MSKFLAVTVPALVWVLTPTDLRADESKASFAKLAFLKGTWESAVKLSDRTYAITSVSFSPILNDRFLQVTYTVAEGEKKRTHQVIVGPGEKDALKAWTFTSEGKAYESTVRVKATEASCALEVVTGKDTVNVTFTKAAGDSFTLEYENKAKSLGPVKASFRKSR